MKATPDFSSMKEEIKQELRPELYKIVRDCLKETTLNIKII
jgi:hypothetical protein